MFYSWLPEKLRDHVALLTIYSALLSIIQLLVATITSNKYKYTDTVDKGHFTKGRRRNEMQSFRELPGYFFYYIYAVSRAYSVHNYNHSI